MLELLAQHPGKVWTINDLVTSELIGYGIDYFSPKSGKQIGFYVYDIEGTKQHFHPLQLADGHLEESLLDPIDLLGVGKIGVKGVKVVAKTLFKLTTKKVFRASIKAGIRNIPPRIIAILKKIAKSARSKTSKLKNLLKQKLGGKPPAKTWNEFQKLNKGKGLSPKEMSERWKQYKLDHGLEKPPKPAPKPTTGTHEHHSDPKFLGGDPKQPTTSISVDSHKELHRDLNKFLETRRNKAGRHMRPQRGNSGQTIRWTFRREERLKAMAEFYRVNKGKYPEAARDFFKQHPELK